MTEKAEKSLKTIMTRLVFFLFHFHCHWIVSRPSSFYIRSLHFPIFLFALLRLVYGYVWSVGLGLNATLH